MRKIEINITKAQIVSFSVTLNEDKPRIDATIALLDEGGQAVSNYSASTEEYYGNTKEPLKLSVNMIKNIMEIFDELEIAVVRNCREGQLSLKEGK